LYKFRINSIKEKALTNNCKTKDDIIKSQSTLTGIKLITHRSKKYGDWDRVRISCKRQGTKEKPSCSDNGVLTTYTSSAFFEW